METTENTQPEAGTQEAESNSVANKLGHLNEHSLSDLLKTGFLDEKEATPATEGKEEESSDSEESLSDEPPQEEEGESDQPEAEESSLTKGVQKRINKLVAAKKAAQAELEAHKERISQLTKELEVTKSAVPVKHDDFSDYIESLDTIEKVNDEYKKTVDYILECERNPDGFAVTMPDGTERELTDKEVRAAKAAFIKRKEIELPARMHYLQTQVAHEQQTLNDFPWLAKPETEEYRTAQMIIRDFPELKKRRPDWKHVIGLLVMGSKAYVDMKSNASKKNSSQIKRAPSQPGVSKAPPSLASSSNELAKAKERFVKNSNQSGLNDLVKAMGFV